MTDWLRKVGEHTKADRIARARALITRRAEVCSGMRRDGFGEATIAQKARWYDQRARGHRERIERVEACATALVTVSCQCCGVARDFSAGCRSWLLCLRCRSATAAQWRARFRSARDVVVARAAARGLLREFRPRGRWGERFLTLTMPHGVRSIRERIALALDAWPVFLRLFNAYLDGRDLQSVEWFRVFEWTPGADGFGHPHFHVWIFSPFIHVNSVCEWWRHALESVGGEVVDHVVVDLRAVTEPSDASNELIKYMLKDISANGEKLAPELFAAVFAALKGRRMRQASRGFMGLSSKVKPCCECGAVLPKRVRVSSKSETKPEKGGAE
ncbi:MAG: hypothetical protein QM756_12670 [Polyangiaceae bacterium]